MGVVVPMKILITDTRIAEDPVVMEQLEKLRKQGHEILVDDTYRQYDFICGGNCWYLKLEVANLFLLAITNARKIANADQERVDKVKLTKAAKRKPKLVSKKSTGAPVLSTTSDPVEGGC